MVNTGNIKTRGLATGCSGPRRPGHRNPAYPGPPPAGSGWQWPSRRHPARHRCSPKLSEPPPWLPWARNLAEERLPSLGKEDIAYLRSHPRRSSPRRTREVLPESLFSGEPIDLAAVGAACASSSHPPGPSPAEGRTGFSWGRCSKEGGGVLGDTLRSISDGQMESTLSPS